MCCYITCSTSFAQQEITVSPASVNVYSQGATTVRVSYSNLRNYRAAETAWCGDVVPATPAIGFRCVPSTIYGSLPARYDISRRSGDSYTDVVSVPAAIARKAYHAAASGKDSEFFYVRRFSADEMPDQFVVVRMRLSGAGAGTPFSLTDVQVGFGVNSGPLVLSIEPGGKVPPLQAQIKHTGTGRLVGQWEIVMPGEARPEPRDLLTEASVPLEERGSQQRFTQLSRFNVLLPSGGRFILPGPDPLRIPNRIPGQYLILLRIEASDDGAVAGFPMPVLRYVVGGGDNTSFAFQTSTFTSLLPREGVTLRSSQPVDFVWSEMPKAVYYRLEVGDVSGTEVLSAVLKSGVVRYRAPSWFKDRIKVRSLKWRVIALDENGRQISASEERHFQIAP